MKWEGRERNRVVCLEGLRIEHLNFRIRNSSAEVDTRSNGDSLFVYTFLSVTGYQRVYKNRIQITVSLKQYLDYRQQTEELLFDFRKRSEVLVLYGTEARGVQLDKVREPHFLETNQARVCLCSSSETYSCNMIHCWKELSHNSPRNTAFWGSLVVCSRVLITRD